MTASEDVAGRVVRIEDAPNWAAERFGLPPEVLDLRILRGLLGCEHLGVSYLTFGPRPEQLRVGHRHPAGEEVYVLVSGRARMKIDAEVIVLDAPCAVRVRGEEFRGIQVVGDEPAVFVVVGYPIENPDSTEIDPTFWKCANAVPCERHSDTRRGAPGSAMS